MSGDTATLGRVKAEITSSGSTCGSPLGLVAYGPETHDVNDGLWHHVVVVFDRTAGITVWVDGISNTTAGDTSALDVSSNADLKLGTTMSSSETAGYSTFEGALDEVALYAYTLSAAQVQSHWQAAGGDSVGHGPLGQGALNNYWGQRYLVYGYCCGGAAITGTDANIKVTSIGPGTQGCIAFSSVAAGAQGPPQLQAGLVKCASGWSVDTTCAGFVKFVETHNGSSYNCFPHGSASSNTTYDVKVVQSSTSSVWQAKINSTGYESQSGFNNNVRIMEWGERLGPSGCSGWSGSAQFSSWQRKSSSLSSSWTTVNSSNASTHCWAVSTMSAGLFVVSH